MTDLAEVAARLSRAADLIEQLAGDAGNPGDGSLVRWTTAGGSVIWEPEVGLPDALLIGEEERC